jgi:chromosome segregation ATPase
MLPDIARAIQLQILDDRAAELTKGIAALPRHIAEIEKKMESHQRRLEHDRAALVANQKDRKSLEGEIQTNDQKISKLKAQMMEAKNNDPTRWIKP